MKIFIEKKIENVLIFNIFAQNLDRGYTLEEFHNLCFGSKIRKIGIPQQTPILLYEVGYEGVCISQTCFPDVDHCLIT